MYNRLSFFRDWRIKLLICWNILTDNYCDDKKSNCWRLFGAEIDVVFHRVD